ncbi:MAG: D-alanine--D-alanine ligase [Treponema sp.]|nr:D-alanine--D-alanine ligase [Treponema sp.]
MNITLIYGGRSGEHEISLISASAILRGIDKKHTINLIGITKSGKWYLQSQDEVKRVCNDSTATLQITEDASSMVNIIPGGHTECFCVNGEPIITDVVFPALHGTYGEDGKIQGLLEMADIAFVGCSTMASSLTMDKEKTKQVLEACGISVVPYICMKRCDMLNSNRYDQLFNKAIETLGFPLFVKPCCAGSSNGASKAENPRQLSFALMEAFSWDDKVLIEKAIDAREIECSVTGNSVSYPSDSETEIVKAYLPGEILPTHTFYDYDAKYKDPNGAGLQIPADLSPDMIETIRSEAVKIYKALDAEGLSRVDFFIDKETNDLYFNEINTMPGFTSISMFPKMCEKTGLNFTNLLELLITQALERFLSKSTLQTSR